MQDDHANGEPLSSALIVNRNTGISSPGFFEMARSLGYVFNDNEQFWREQCDRCFDRFNDATVSMTLSTGLTDEEQEKIDRADNAIAAAMIAAGVVERAAWAGETLNGRRVVRLRTGDRIVLELTEAELAESSEVTLVEKVKNRLAR
jgi:siroheme synthase